jgi:hypothetical protein
VLDEKDYNYFIKNWWDITTTISLNGKDVKRKRISAKTFEQLPPTTYKNHRYFNL